VDVMNQQPNLILSDFHMPNMNGLEFLTTLRSANVTTPLGFITTLSTDVQRQKLLDSGADFFLAKPFGPDELTRTLKGLGLSPTTTGHRTPRPMLVDWFVDGLLDVRISFPQLRMECDPTSRRLRVDDLARGVVVRIKLDDRPLPVGVFASEAASELIARSMMSTPAGQQVGEAEVEDGLQELGNLAMAHVLRRGESTLAAGARVTFRVQYLTGTDCVTAASRVAADQVQIMSGNGFELFVLSLGR